MLIMMEEINSPVGTISISLSNSSLLKYVILMFHHNFSYPLTSYFKPISEDEI